MVKQGALSRQMIPASPSQHLSRIQIPRKYPVAKTFYPGEVELRRRCLGTKALQGMSQDPFVQKQRAGVCPAPGATLTITAAQRELLQSSSLSPLPCGVQTTLSATVPHLELSKQKLVLFILPDYPVQPYVPAYMMSCLSPDGLFLSSQ